MAKFETDELLEETIGNIRKDRNVAVQLLTHLMEGAKNDFSKNVAIAGDAAKVIETLQKSNEQLVKVVSLLFKENNGNISLNETDREELFDQMGTGQKND